MLFNFNFDNRLQQRYWIYSTLLLLFIGYHFQSLVKAESADIDGETHPRVLPVPRPPHIGSLNVPVESQTRQVIAQIEDLDDLGSDSLIESPRNGDSEPHHHLPEMENSTLPTQSVTDGNSSHHQTETDIEDNSRGTNTGIISDPSAVEYIAKQDQTTRSFWNTAKNNATGGDDDDFVTPTSDEILEFNYVASNQSGTAPVPESNDDDDDEGSGYTNFRDIIVVSNNNQTSNISQLSESSNNFESRSIQPSVVVDFMLGDSVQTSISAGRNTNHLITTQQDTEVNNNTSSYQMTSTVSNLDIQFGNHDSVQSSMVIPTILTDSYYSTHSWSMQSSLQHTQFSTVSSTVNISFPTIHHNEIEVAQSNDSDDKLKETISLKFSQVLQTETINNRQENGNDSSSTANTVLNIPSTTSSFLQSTSVTSTLLFNSAVSTSAGQPPNFNQTSHVQETNEDASRQVTTIPHSEKDFTPLHSDKNSHKNVVEDILLNGEEPAINLGDNNNDKGNVNDEQQNNNLNEVLRSNLDPPLKVGNNSDISNKKPRKQNLDGHQEHVTGQVTTTTILKQSKFTNSQHPQLEKDHHQTITTVHAGQTIEIVPTSTTAIQASNSFPGTSGGERSITNATSGHRLNAPTTSQQTKTGHEDASRDRPLTRDDDDGQTEHRSTASNDKPFKSDLPVNKPSSYLTVTMQCSWSYFCKHRKDIQDLFAKHLSHITYTSVGDAQIKFFDINTCNHIMVEQVDTNEIATMPISVSLYVTDKDGGYNEGLTERLSKVILNRPPPGANKTLQDKVLLVHFRRQEDDNGSSSSSSRLTPSNDNMGIIAAVTISSIAGIALLLLFSLLIVLKRRYGMKTKRGRCRPVTDAYSLDSMSIYSSFRKRRLRASKRSYLNQGFEDPNAPSNKMTYSEIVNFFFSKDNIIHEFKKLPMTMAKLDELPSGVDIKNRYANVIPFSESRVNLTAKPDEPNSDYINANYVRGLHGDQRIYIACQAPLENTVSDFWQMVWENQVKVIFMLTDFVEDGVEKCAIYFSDSTTDCHKLYGDYQVTTKEIDIREKFTISSFQLRNLEKNLVRDVVHFWYTAWPTQGVPNDKQSIIDMLSEARPIVKTSHGSTVVHCSPGTGRTGTVITIDICMQEYEATRTVDVPHTVYHLRMDRGGLVQTTDQYIYIYEVLKEYASQLTQYSGRSSLRSSR